MPDPVTFRNAAAFRRWLEKHHDTASELTLRCFRVHAAARGITYLEALDEALCFGWIDGVRRGYDHDSFTQRFTPRRRGSNWSRVNIGKVTRLVAAGRMRPPGLAAFKARTSARSGVYSFEQRVVAFSRPLERRFRANQAAWRDFTGRAPWYRRTTTHWVMSAKRDETRLRRLQILINACARGKPIAPLERK